MGLNIAKCHPRFRFHIGNPIGNFLTNLSLTVLRNVLRNLSTFFRLSINSGKSVNLLAFLTFYFLSVNIFAPRLRKAEGRNVTSLKPEQLEVYTYLYIYS